MLFQNIDALFNISYCMTEKSTIITRLHFLRSFDTDLQKKFEVLEPFVFSNDFDINNAKLLLQR